MLGEHHGTNGNQSVDKEPIDSVTKKNVSIAPDLSHGDSLGAIHHFPGVYRGSLMKMRFQTFGQIEIGQILSYQCFRTA